MLKITESTSEYRQLENMTVEEILACINHEDSKVAVAVKLALPQINNLVNALVQKLKNGGRLFYIGAGTSGRLGILDASECPPTFGVPHEMVIGIIAGGDGAIRKAVEFAEDDEEMAWEDLSKYNIDPQDFIIGIAASGTTPYVLGGLKKCQEMGISTGCITCNPASPITSFSDFAIEVAVGPEFVTGSTRMKAGTAQKMVLNMITTASMIRIGRVIDNKMVDMQLSNNKLIDRGIRMIREQRNMSHTEAKQALLKLGSVRAVLESFS